MTEQSKLTAAGPAALPVAQPSSPPDQEAMQAARRSIGQRLLGEFNDLATRRQPLDQEMLACHYQYTSQYSPTELAEIQGMRENACKLFLGLSRMKVLTMDARINEMGPGAAGKNWSIAPTPEPEPTPELLAEAENIKNQDPESGALSIDERLRMAARARADRMDRQMEDHLVEIDYIRLLLDVAHSGHNSVVGILKGPLASKDVDRAWSRQPANAAWEMQERERIRPDFKWVSPWDFYLEWSSRTPEDSELYCERHLFRPARLMLLSQQPGMFPDVIRKWLNDTKNEGDSKYEPWENELFNVTGREGQQPPVRKRYEVIEVWGPLTSAELIAVGMEEKLKRFGVQIDEASASLIEAHIWIARSTGEVLGLDLNPYKDKARPYHFYIPTPDAGSVYGTSFQAAARPVQSAINGAFRMTFDNAAPSVMPQIELRMQRLLSPGDLKRIYPGRIWAVKEDPWNASTPAVRFSDFPNHTQIFLALINALQTLFDDVTGIPRAQQGAGAPGMGRTASGLAMLMGAAGQRVKDQLRAWDRFWEGTLQSLFNWEMEFNPREDIKGDHKVKITSTTSILQKAQFADSIRDFRMSTLNPLDAIHTKRRPMLEDEAKARDLDPARVVKTVEDLMSDQEHQAAAAVLKSALASGNGIPGMDPNQQQPGIPAGPPGAAGATPEPQPAPPPIQPPAMARGGSVTVEDTLAELERRYPDLLSWGGHG